MSGQVIIGTALRVHMREAERHFRAGGTVLVDELGDRIERLVSEWTTTHNATTTTWVALVADVRMWLNRYPNQKFYIVKFDAQ